MTKLTLFIFSGAGKTTFLVSLAGKCTLPSAGSVMINGTKVKDLHIVEIVPQFEVFVDGLTVTEHLIFMVSGSSFPGLFFGL